MSWVTQNPLNIIKGGDNKQGGFTKVKVEIDRIYTVLSGLFSTSGHGHTGSENDGPQIGTGGLADKAITTEKINDKAITSTKLAPTTVAGYGITDVYDKTTSDGKYAPSGYGLGGNVTNIDNPDLNTMKTTGWFYVANATNAVEPPYGFLMVEAVSSNYCIQTYSPIGSNIRHTRDCSNGIWLAWKQLANTDNPAFTGNITCSSLTGASATFQATSPTGYGGLRIYNDSNTYLDNLEFTLTGTQYNTVTETFPASEYAKIMATANIPLIIGTNSLPRLTILGNGNVGIGTIDPKATLHSTGTTILGVGADSSWTSHVSNSQMSMQIDSTTLYLYVKDATGGFRTIQITLPAVNTSRII